MMFRSISAAPASLECRRCRVTKPLAEMMVFRSRSGAGVYVRPRCKECNNSVERGHRREYKAEYLRRWRKNNAELNESYWRAANERDRAKHADRAREFYRSHRAAVVIQCRLRTRGYHISWRDASLLAKEYGPAYPLTSGLNAAGKREAQRLRSKSRRGGRAAMPIHKIVMALWERPKYRLPHREQPRLLKERSKRMRLYWETRRRAAEEAA